MTLWCAACFAVNVNDDDSKIDLGYFGGKLMASMVRTAYTQTPDEVSKFKYWFPFRYISHRLWALSLSQTRAQALEQFFYFYSICSDSLLANCWNALQRTHFSPQVIASTTTKCNKSFPDAKVFFRHQIRIDYINLISDRCSVRSFDAFCSKRATGASQVNRVHFGHSTNKWRVPICVCQSCLLVFAVRRSASAMIVF